MMGRCDARGGCSVLAVVDPSKWVPWVLQALPVTVIVGAAIAYIFREIEAARSRKRERKGLLRLLAVEIEFNETVLEEITETPIVLSELPGASLHTQAWEENRGRIAQLLKRGEDFQDLADYFMNVAAFEKYRLEGLREEDVKQHTELLLGHISALLKQGEDAMQVVIRGTGGKVEPRVKVPTLEAPKDDI
jgi:hypothetical protein